MKVPNIIVWNNRALWAHAPPKNHSGVDAARRATTSPAAVILLRRAEKTCVRQRLGKIKIAIWLALDLRHRAAL
jgi:hypothetical protein